MSFSSLEERTYGAMLGPLGGEAIVCAECVFIDPIGDIAVLRSPDSQELWDEAEAYEKLVDAAQPLPVGDMADEAQARLPSLDQRWIECKAHVRPNGMIHVFEVAEGIEGGMSGSPIVVDGVAVGVVTCSGGGLGKPHTEGSEARLSRNLPGWLLREFGIWKEQPEQGARRDNRLPMDFGPTLAQFRNAKIDK
jgi:hypothetical protein